MKNLKGILAFILSIFIIFSSISQYTLVVFASDHGGSGGSDRETTLQKKLQEFKEGSITAWECFKDDWGMILAYWASMTGALVTKDFASFVSSHEAFEKFGDEKFINSNVSVDNDGNMVLSSELINLIKQALREYAEETCGFIIVPSVHIDSVSPSLVGNGYVYNTMKNFAKEYGMISVERGSNYFMVYDMSGFVNNDAGFFLIADKSEFENRSYYRLDGMNFKSWAPYRGSKYLFLRTDELNKDLTSWEDAAEFCASASLSRITNSGSSSYFNFIKPPYSITSLISSYPHIITNDGRNVLIFNSKTALQNYSVDHRSIYFGSKFYEDTGEITAAFEDLQNYLDGKYDDFLEKLKEMIGGSNLSEEDLEKLVDKLLDQLKDVEGSIGDVDNSLKETNSLLEQILQVLESIDETVQTAFLDIEMYLDAILEQLGIISWQLEDMTVEEAGKKTDSMIDQLYDLFSEVGALLKTKFPFSIPWDVQNIMNIFSGIGTPTNPVQPVNYNAYSSSGFVTPYADNNIDVHDRDGIYAKSDDEAPYFEIPFLLSESMNLEGSLVIDLSWFDTLSQISRTMFTVIFAYGLIQLTFKVMEGLGGEIFD